jgi:hypothetical protein
MIYVQPSVARATLAAMSEFFLVAHQDPPPYVMSQFRVPTPPWE